MLRALQASLPLLRPTILTIVLAGCGAASSPPSAPSELLSQESPTFRRPALDGSMIDTSAWRGRVALVDFFSEHCVPCGRALPAVEALHRDQPDVMIVGVSEDDDADGAQRMAARYGLSFPVVHDSEHMLAGRFRVGEMPATFVVDPRGLVKWRGAGESEDELRAVLRDAR